METQPERADVRRGPLDGRLRPVVVLLVFLAGVLICSWYSLRLGLADNWDFRNYHYYNAYALLTGRIYFDYAPAQIQSFLNPLPFVPTYLLAGNFSAKTTGFVMGGIHGLSFGLIFIMGLSLLSAFHWIMRLLIALACAAIGIYSPSFLAELGSSSSDSMSALFVLAATCALVVTITAKGAPDARSARRGIIIGGLLMGFAGGLKLTAAAFLPAAFLALLLTSRSRRSAMPTGLWFAGAAFAGSLLSRGYWMAFLWKRFDSPLFPFYNRIFRSEYFDLINWSDRHCVPSKLWNCIRMPFLFLDDNNITEQAYNFRDGRYAVIGVLIIILLFVLLLCAFRRKRRTSTPPGVGRAAAFLVIAFGISFYLWVALFSIYRYTVALEFISGVVIVSLIFLITQRTYARLAMILAAFVLVAVVMKPGWYPRRGEWPEKYVTVQVPELERPADTIILMISDDPYSYVIPFFPPEIRFVGLWSTYAKRRRGSDKSHRGNREMMQLVKAHEGPLYVLARSLDHDPNNKFQELGLRIVEQEESPAQSDRGLLSDEPALPPAGGTSTMPLKVQTSFDGALYLWPVEIKK